MAVSDTIILPPCKRIWGDAGNPREHLTVVSSYVHAAQANDHEVNIDNSAGWDWMMLMCDHEADGGTVSIGISVNPWIEHLSAYNGHGNAGGVIGPSMSFNDTDSGYIRYKSLGAGAASGQWNGSGENQPMVGPLPQKFQFHFDSTADISMTYSISALVGLGLMG
jgi:hypothetical protein